MTTESPKDESDGTAQVAGPADDPATGEDTAAAAASSGTAAGADAAPEPGAAEGNGAMGDRRTAEGTDTGDDPATAEEVDPAGGADDGSSTPATARELAERKAAERRAEQQARKEERRRRRRERPQLKKLRFLLVITGLSLLAVVSWVFGVMMAVAGNLPDLEARAQFDRAENSVVVDRFGNRIATLTGNQRRILLESEDISPFMKEAVVAIEDERFYEHRGIDYLGLARALREDILAGGAVQGGSTITQQFVKNALAAQQDRTVLQKLKESALAYQVERQWSKDKILTNYLNNIYFGEGAYGIEAAAKTFFGSNHPDCGGQGAEPCASVLRVEEAAMLAGMISSPSAYNPKTSPEAARERRDLVLAKMRELGTLEVSDSEFADLQAISPPSREAVEPPEEASQAPYFTDWLRQQVVDRYGAGEAFGGGLEVQSTLDLELQQAAQEVVESRISGLGPTAAVVAIENGTGKVRAMVGGTDFNETPFNVATNGLRQPGSSFKPFTLITALANGVSQDTVYSSEPKEIPFENEIRTKNGKKKTVNEVFKVANYEDSYLGSATIRDATTYSDNSVYAELGTDIGPDKIADMAEDLGIQSRVPDNPAMILGGLKRGVTPLEMAYAYATIANRGTMVSGTMASRGKAGGPVAIEEVTADGDKVSDDLGASGKNEEVEKEIVETDVADETIDILNTVVTSGTGQRAQVGDDFIWGKTGTTDNNADAWFVGANESLTVAVWVGYEDGATPMETEFGGAPVDGGTIPALIFNGVISAWDSLQAGRNEDEDSDSEETTTLETTTAAPVAPAPAPAPAPVEEAPPTEAPAPPPEPEPAPEEAPPVEATPPPGDSGGAVEDGATAPGE